MSDLFLGLKSPPNPDYIEHGVNGHNYNFDATSIVPMVFDRLDCYRGDAPLTDHDFSSYAYGVERRMLNFLPKTPFGMVGIVPDDIDPKTFPRLREKITTDGRSFHEGGRTIAPADYKRVALGKLEQAAARLPLRVKGDVAWSVVRLDSKHVRVTLIDAGDLDPADRNGEVVLQHLDATRCTDILSGASLPIRNGRVRVSVPAGIFSVIDIEHR